MKQRVNFVFTHDSIGLGEDGPTHQHIEHAAILRLTPNLEVWRPCDTVETAIAWESALQRTSGPTALLLTRQNVPHQVRDDETLGNAIYCGGYILWENQPIPEVIIIATGSEVALAMSAAQALAEEEIAVRVVSMPCVEVFETQTSDYKESVLPSAIKARVAVEAGVTNYWRAYVGLEGQVIGIDRFGESAPASKVFNELNVTVAAVINAARQQLCEESKA
jgi:transketolase